MERKTLTIDFTKYRVSQNVVSHLYRIEERNNSGNWRPVFPSEEFTSYTNAVNHLQYVAKAEVAEKAEWVPVDKDTAGIHPALIVS